VRDAECLFCKIVHKEVDSTLVNESANALAFRDINPAAPTHVLIIPKDHIVSARDLTAEHGKLVGEIFELAARIASDEGLEDYRLVSNVGAGAGQSVFHLHFHVLGGRSMSWPPG
jgi:histidine triad (HIT) family protein